MGKILAVVALVVAVWFALMAGGWSLWCWVLPQIWSSGPEAFIRPGFWLFVGTWTLFSLLTAGIRGASK